MRAIGALVLLCTIAMAQDAARLEQAKKAVVGVRARRMLSMRGRQFPVNATQVGVLVGPRGLVLTPSLGEDAQNIRVFLPGSTEAVDAEVVDSDASFTLLRMEEKAPKPIQFARDWKPSLGQKLVWVGLLPGVGKWAPVVKEGSVDALIEDENATGPMVYSDPPFSGQVNAVGALVLNSAGEAIGVVATRRAQNQGGGMRRTVRGGGGILVVRPASAFAHYLGGEIVKRGLLGVTVEALAPKVAEAMGMKGVRGVIVTQVTPGSGAAAAGIEAQDVITSVDGAATPDGAALRRALAGKAAGTEVAVTLMRIGDAGPETRELKVTLTAREEAGKEKRFKARRFGFTAEPISPAVKRNYQLPADLKGVHVRKIVAGSPAALGRPQPLRRGDIILRVGQIPVADMETLKKALKAAENGKPVTLFVRHATQTRFVEITPESSDE